MITESNTVNGKMKDCVMTERDTCIMKIGYYCGMTATRTCIMQTSEFCGVTVTQALCKDRRFL